MKRRLGVFEPEEVAVEPRNEVVALEPLGVAQRSLGNRQGPIPRCAGSRNFGTDAVRAPVRQASVVFVAAGDDGEDRMRFEILLNQAVTDHRPSSPGGGGRRGSVRFAGPSARGERRCEHDDKNSETHGRHRDFLADAFCLTAFVLRAAPAARFEPERSEPERSERVERSERFERSVLSPAPSR